MKIKRQIKHSSQILQNRLFGNLLVLMYHRISEYDSDPYSTFVSPQNFENHLEILKQLGEVIPAAAIPENCTRKIGRGLKFVLTFDDGYRDNFETALPLLEKKRMPAVFFIVERGNQTFPAYYWDVLQGIFLETEQLPGEFIAILNGREIPVLPG